MKTVNDFSLVPLDKWIDLYDACLGWSAMPWPVASAVADVAKRAKTEVKTEEDFNREIVEYFDSVPSKDLPTVVQKLLEQRTFAIDKEIMDTLSKPEDVIK